MEIVSPCSSDAGKEEQLETIVQRSNGWSLPYWGSLETWDFCQQKGAFSTCISEFTEPVYCPNSQGEQVPRSKDDFRATCAGPCINTQRKRHMTTVGHISAIICQSCCHTRFVNYRPWSRMLQGHHWGLSRPWTINPCCSSTWQITTLPKESWNKSRGTRVLGARVSDIGPQVIFLIFQVQGKV